MVRSFTSLPCSSVDLLSEATLKSSKRCETVVVCRVDTHVILISEVHTIPLGEDQSLREPYRSVPNVVKLALETYVFSGTVSISLTLGINIIPQGALSYTI